MRSTAFLTASILVHAICFTALAMNHFRGENTTGSEIEVAMGEATMVADAGTAAKEVTPEIKPLPKPLPKKAVIKEKKIAKAAKPTPAKTLPAKEFIAETDLPQNMSPEIEDSQTVAVAPEKTTDQPDEKLELIPVKDAPPAGVQAATSEEVEDKTTEAVSKELNESKDPAPVTSEEVGQGAKTEAAPVVKGGETKSAAISYLNLKQFSGNKPPVYPMSARKEQREGQVDLLYRVAKDGHIAEVQVAKSSGHPDLDEAAVKSVSKYKYVPGQEGWARHPVIFSIKGVATTLPSKLRGGGSSASAE